MFMAEVPMLISGRNYIGLDEGKGNLQNFETNSFMYGFSYGEHC
jgi:hypothetical protein